jgi:hypothetical protein
LPDISLWQILMLKAIREDESVFPERLATGKVDGATSGKFRLS